MSEALQALPKSPAEWDGFIGAHVTSMVAALPLTIPDEALKRARSHLKIAFLRAPPASKVFECHPVSVSNCIAMSALTGLYPGGPNPDVDLIPRHDKHLKCQALHWQISYRGYKRLCRRNPGWELLPFIVFDGDSFGWGVDSTRGPWFEHHPGNRPNLGDPEIAWKAIRYAVPLLRSPTGLLFDVLDKGQIEARRSCAKDQSFWTKWPIEKTLAAACRYAGQREMYPTDDPARYGMQLDVDQEVGAALAVEPREALTSADVLGLPPGPPDAGAPVTDPSKMLDPGARRKHLAAIRQARNEDAAVEKLGPPGGWTEDDEEDLLDFAKPAE